MGSPHTDQSAQHAAAPRHRRASAALILGAVTLTLAAFVAVFVSFLLAPMGVMLIAAAVTLIVTRQRSTARPAAPAEPLSPRPPSPATSTASAAPPAPTTG